MRSRAVGAGIVLAVCSCAFVTESPRFEPRLEPSRSFTEHGPAKVHMLDGSVVIFATGISVRHDTLYPVAQRAVAPSTPSRLRRQRPSDGPIVRTVRAVRYDLARQHGVEVEAVPMESVVGIQHYDRHTNFGSGLAWLPVWISAIGGGAAWLLVGMILAGAPW